MLYRHAVGSDGILNIRVFCSVTLCSWLDRYEYFRGICCLQLHSLREVAVADFCKMLILPTRQNGISELETVTFVFTTTGIWHLCSKQHNVTFHTCHISLPLEYQSSCVLCRCLCVQVNFDQWFSTTLTQELKMKGGNYRVIRRRVAWLIGQWTGVKLSSELRPALYAVTLPLLQGDEDMAVRLTASNTLKLAVDDFEFNTDQFLPFLEPSFALLFALLKEVHECDTKVIFGGFVEIKFHFCI